MAEPDRLFLQARSLARASTAGEHLATLKGYLVALAKLDPKLETVEVVVGSPKPNLRVQPSPSRRCV